MDGDAGGIGTQLEVGGRNLSATWRGGGWRRWKRQPKKP
jgi:hypothetical protein